MQPYAARLALIRLCLTHKAASPKGQDDRALAVGVLTRYCLMYDDDRTVLELELHAFELLKWEELAV